jgi:hypothetical protein
MFKGYWPPRWPKDDEVKVLEFISSELLEGKHVYLGRGSLKDM